MHSAYETAGRYDLDELLKALNNFYSKNLKVTDDNNFIF
jgi:aspartyl aminopeptidase